jgi:hypothetical protein
MEVEPGSNEELKGRSTGSASRHPWKSRAIFATNCLAAVCVGFFAGLSITRMGMTPVNVGMLVVGLVQLSLAIAWCATGYKTTPMTWVVLTLATPGWSMTRVASNSDRYCLRLGRFSFPAGCGGMSPSR